MKEKYFVRKTDATAFASAKKAELAAFGVIGNDLTAEERSAVARSRPKLDYYGASLETCISMGIAALELQAKEEEGGMTISELVTAVIQERDREGVAAATLEDYKYRLKGRFGRAFGSRLVWSVSREEIDEWLQQQSEDKTTQQRYRQLIKTAFFKAVDLGIRPDNPATTQRRIHTRNKRREASRKIGVLTPDQAEGLLAHASPDCVPPLAICLFAGVRPGSPSKKDVRGELMRMDWTMVHFDSNEIVLPDEVTKTGVKRVIPMSDNLVAWLSPLRKQTGKIVPPNYQAKRKAAIQEARITKWPHDATRHSFASYHYALHKNANILRDLMGHEESSRMLEHHYKAVVSRSAAEAYWSITPTV